VTETKRASVRDAGPLQNFRPEVSCSASSNANQAAAACACIGAEVGVTTGTDFEQKLKTPRGVLSFYQLWQSLTGQTPANPGTS
jgi:hypothetical protein